jgi:hypothetical protein
MIPYLGCLAAREMLEAFVDGELSMADQVAVESHLRWCETCRARVEDMRMIGASLRIASGRCHHNCEDARALAAIQSEVLTLTRAERDHSLRARIAEMFADMRFFWPALGATAAVIACIFTAVGVLHAANDEQTDSMAAVVASTADASRVRTGWVLEGVPEEEAVFALATLVTRKGRITSYEKLVMEPSNVLRSDGSAIVADVRGLLDAVRQSRFAPYEEDRATAVDMVWLTQEKEQKPAVSAALAPRARPPAPHPARS